MAGVVGDVRQHGLTDPPPVVYFNQRTAPPVASLLVTRVLTSQLHDVSATDPLTFLLGPAVLLAVALVACYLPARRATRVEAVTALRAE